MTREEKTKDWRDVLSEMPLEQAQQVVKDVRKKWAEYLEYLEQGPCEDAISREDVLDEINRVGVKGFETYDDYSQLYDFVDTLPSITPQPKTGHWIGRKKIGFGEWKECIVPLKDGFVTKSCSCSECGEWLTASDEYACNGNYCPNCGVKMESEDEK